MARRERLPRDPNQRGKAVVDAVAEKSEREEPEGFGARRVGVLSLTAEGNTIVPANEVASRYP